MFEWFNYEIKDLCATNSDLLTYIDSVNKECAEYPEQNTLHFNTVDTIPVDSDSLTQQRKQNGRKEDFQEKSQIYLNENEENKSITATNKIQPNVNKTIEPNANKIIEQNANKTIEQNASNKSEQITS